VGVCSEGSDLTVKYKNLENRFIDPGPDLNFTRKTGSFLPLFSLHSMLQFKPKAPGRALGNLSALTFRLFYRFPPFETLTLKLDMRACLEVIPQAAVAGYAV
jgi:hypothetical protein